MNAWTLRRPLAALAAFGLALALTAAGTPAVAATYTSASTPYSFIDSSTHAKLGYNTTPYKFNASSGCGSTPPVLDDTLSDAIPIGFPFTFGTTAYTTAYVMSNGRLQFGNTTCGYGTASVGPPQTYPYGYPVSGMNATMKIFGVDLDPTNLADKPNYPSSTSKTPCTSASVCYVSYATIGSAPARRFVVTWKSVPEWVTASNTSGSFDLQIILNEDGTFVFQYGTISHGGTGTAQIGWQLSTTDYQVLSFGASSEPSPFSAIKFFLPSPVASYTFDETAWVPGLAGQVNDSIGSRNGLALGDAQTDSTAKTCRSAKIPLNTDAATVDAVQTGVNLNDASLNLHGTGTIGFWYRSNAPWSGSGAHAAQLLDATAVAGQWFFLAKTAAGALVFEVTDSTGAVRTVTSPAQSFAANTWVHVAVTWNFNGLSGSNQDALQIFVNAGTPTTGSFTSSGTVTAQAGTLSVGDNPLGVADTQGSVTSADGYIDDVAVYNYVLTQAQVNTLMNSTHACAGYTIDHVELQHASGTGVTCTPSTLTIRACANAACSSLYTGGLSGVLSATGTPTTNWDGSSGNGSGARFTIAAGSSSVTKNFQVTTVGSVVLGAGSLSPATTSASTCTFGSPSCTFTAADSGFLFSVPAHAAETSQSVAVRAVKTSDGSLSCTPAFANATKAVTFTCAYGNPSSGTRAVRIGGAALNAAGNAGAACDAQGASVNLAFDATGTATTTLQYADVGSLNLLARHAPSGSSDGGLVMTGSATFVARPADFTLTSIHCSSMSAGQCAAALASPGNNPGATSASGAAFIPAGRAFSATVTAVNAAGAPTPNFGRESPAEGVLLSASLLQPAGGSSGTLSGAGIAGSAFSAGAATVSNLSYSEVGIVGLSAAVLDGNYLGSGAVSGTTVVNVGRFVPAGFALSATSVTQRSTLSCSPASAFTYLGENFRLGFTLTAQNAAGATTANYDGSFAKFDPTSAAAYNLAGIDGTTVFTGASGRLSLGTATGSWSHGVAAGIALTAAAGRAAAPDGPFNASFGIAAVDADGTGMSAFDMASTSGGANDRAAVGSVPLRFGRLRLSSGIGAADRALSLPVTAQYWNGSAFDTNTLDSCTTVPAGAFSFGNLRGTLATADAAVASAPAIAAGTGTLRLSPPGGGRRGTYDVAASLGASATDASCLQPWTPATGKAATAGTGQPYLRGAWCSGSYDKDPAARVTFGLQRTQDNIVYRRENF